ncbi:MAG: glycoside hydrolase 100 family protein, partial [Dolichospermum sp.]
AVAVKTKKPELAQKAIEIAKSRLSADEWPEYYDGKKGRLIGKQARKYQTWTITGYLLAQELINHPDYLSLISFNELPPETISRACEFEVKSMDNYMNH